MNSKSNTPQPVFQVSPIGYVRGSGYELYVEVLEKFRPALYQLAHFSHAIVVWWADQHDNPEDRALLQTTPPYGGGVLTGIFATRAEYRPNPVLLTTTPILDVDVEQGIVRVGYLDAYPGTPVLDLKAYFPVSDRPRQVHYPEWLAHWPQYQPEEYWEPT